MDTYEAIRTKLDIREFESKRVDDEAKAKILEAARLTASSMNSQHWRFILVQDPENIVALSQDSTTGAWVRGADFAVIVIIDPKIPGSTIDAGRATQDMQLAAWELGVASGEKGEGRGLPATLRRDGDQQPRGELGSSTRQIDADDAIACAAELAQVPVEEHELCASGLCLADHHAAERTEFSRTGRDVVGGLVDVQ